jgi:hypothetical protein
MLRTSCLSTGIVALLLLARGVSKTHAQVVLPRPIEHLAGGVPLMVGGSNIPLILLDELLKQYQALGLPLPPQKAKLVRYEAGGGGIVNRKVQPKVYSLAFEVKPGTNTENPFLLNGTFEWQPSWNPHAQEVKSEPTSLEGLVLYSHDQLILAIQCHARGWDKLARHLLEKSQKAAELTAQKQLIHLAWGYWKGHVTRPKIDRSPVAKRLKELIQQDKELDTERNRALLRSLELALVPSKAKSGSVEALIDDLVDYQANMGSVGIYEPEDRYWRIARLGFDAVPTLIEHLDDDRLTRAMMMGFNNFRSWNLRVRDIVADLLEEGLAANDLGRDWIGRQRGYLVEKTDVQKWWDQALKMGEETYLLTHVFLIGTDEGKPAQVSTYLLNVILAKYPKHIPFIYRKVLEQRPELDSWMLPKALLQCGLPDKEKLDLLLVAVKHKESSHRLPALEAIKELDQKQFDSLLLATMENIPRDVPGAYRNYPEAYIAGLVISSEDPRVWRTLEQVAKRSAVGLRMELLSHFGGPTDPRHRSQRLRILASFLDDATLREQDSSGKFADGAGYNYHKIEVRDFVALEIADMLGIDIELNLERTSEEWAKIRSRVQEALKRELGTAK